MIAPVRLRAERFYRVHPVVTPSVFSQNIPKNKKNKTVSHSSVNAKKTTFLSTLEIYSWSGEPKGLPADSDSENSFETCKTLQLYQFQNSNFGLTGNESVLLLPVACLRL